MIKSALKDLIKKNTLDEIDFDNLLQYFELSIYKKMIIEYLINCFFNSYKYGTIFYKICFELSSTFIVSKICFLKPIKSFCLSNLSWMTFNSIQKFFIFAELELNDKTSLLIILSFE